MSSNLMDTEIGGENTQYESIKTVTNEPSKLGGQLSSKTATSTKEAADTERGERKAENMRFGQASSEQGVGGFTTADRNSHGVGEESVEKVGRKEQGYDAGKEMDRNIGG